MVSLSPDPLPLTPLPGTLLPLVNSAGEVVGVNTFTLVNPELGLQGLNFAISQTTVQERLSGLTSGVFVAVPTPTPPPNVQNGTYTSETYWYTVDVPSGWVLDDQNQESVIFYDTRTGAMVGIIVEEIDPDRYPTLDTYVAAWQPAPPGDVTDFAMEGSGSRIRRELPVEAHQFYYRYTDAGIPNRRRDDWYVLGKFRVTVAALAPRSVWELPVYFDIRRKMELAQESFQPTNFTNLQIGYSVAHPLNWVSVAGAAFDYRAIEPAGRVEVNVQITGRLGHPDVSSYGTAASVSDANILSRQNIFTARPNPSYRIDYTPVGTGNGTPFRGAAVITLTPDNAVWVFVVAESQLWNSLQEEVGNIFLRAAVLPSPANSVTDANRPPHVFVGVATIGVVPAPDGSEVTAWIDGVQVGEGIVSSGSYSLLAPQIVGVSYIGKTVTFKINGANALQTAIFEQGGATVLNLNVP